MARFSQKQIVILGGIGFLVLLVIVLILFNLRSSETPPNVTLKVWSTLDSSIVGKFLDNYKKIRKNVAVDYRFLPESGYEKAVLDALAAGEGPDVFIIPNRSLSRNKSKLAPANPAQFSLSQMRDYFPQTVEQDLSDAGQVYTLPLYLDTLALIYNRDLLDKASLTRPPQTWEELQGFVPYLRSVNQSGQLVQAAAAIGGSEKNVPHAADILVSLFLQSGVFDPARTGGYTDLTAGQALQTMNFYIQFANSAASAYTWNDAQPEAYESFGSGKTAMVFGYASDAAALRERYPFLNIGIAPMPRLGENPVNYASYEGLAVSKQSKAPEWAWDFVLNFTTVPQNASIYTEATGLPPALRTLVNQYLNHPELGVFARQALTARAWRVADEKQVSALLNQAIAGVISGRLSSYQALQQVQAGLNQMSQ